MTVGGNDRVCTSDETGTCAQPVDYEKSTPLRKGQTVRFTFSPQRDIVHGGPDWCHGKAEISISISGKGAPTNFAKVDFRFYAKP